MLKSNRLNRKPRVLVFIYNSTQIGGPTTAMRLLMNSWLKDEYEFKEIYIDRKLGKIIKLRLINSLRKQIKNYNPDVIHITGLQLHGFYATLSARLAGYKNILLVIRGSSTEAIAFSKTSKWIFGHIIEPITLRLAKVVYTVCYAMAKNPLITKNVKEFGGVVHNAIPNIDLLKYNHDAFRTEIGARPSDILVVYTGRVTNEKGVGYALEAFRTIEDKNIKFIICGNGADLESFKKAYKDEIENEQVIFLGERKDVINVLVGCDVFLFPTLHENLSNSLLEACAVGMPIIATSVGGNPEVIEDGVNGLLIPPEDVLSIRDAIMSLVNDREKMKKLGDKAQEIGHEKFSQDKIFNQVDYFYRTIIRSY